VNERSDTSTSNSSFDKRIQLFVSPDCKGELTGGDAFKTKILGRISSELQNFGSEILQNGSCIHGGFCSNSDVVLRALLQVTMDTADGELQPCLLAPTLNGLCIQMTIRRLALSPNAFDRRSIFCTCFTCHRLRLRGVKEKGVKLKVGFGF